MRSAHPDKAPGKERYALRFSIQRFRKASSTNTMACRRASEGASEGLVLVADYQTEGRGKPGRKWISPSGKNLLFSLLLRPPIMARQAPLLTQVACRSVASVLRRKYGIASTFKRPNDILVHGKKICGILVESSSRPSGRLESAVIGIGLNVNAGFRELIPDAISMKALKNREYNRQKLLKEMLTQLKRDLKGLYARPA